MSGAGSSMPSRPASRDALREASLASRPSTAASATVTPGRVDAAARMGGGGVFKLTRPALPPSKLPQIHKPRRRRSACSNRSSSAGSSRTAAPAPAPRILERQAAFADGEWENELARSILILYGSAMGSGREIDGAENDFAVDRDAVRAPAAQVTQEEIDAGKARELASRQRRGKKKFKRRRKPLDAIPDAVMEEEKKQASKPAPGLSADPNAKPLKPVWYLGTGPVQGEWDCLPEGDDMQLDLQALDEAGKYVQYLEAVGASLNAYMRRRCDSEGEQGRLFGRLWRQLCVAACVFTSRAVDQRRPALAMKLLDRARQYAVASEAHVQQPADARELRAFVEDAYAYYYFCRGKYHAALHCVVKAMKIHVKQQEHAHVAKCHIHSACILARLRRRPEAVRCLGQVLFLVEEGLLDVCGDQPHLLCLVAIAHHNMAVEQHCLGHLEEAVVSAQNARRLARLCLSYSNRWLTSFEDTHRACAEGLARQEKGADHGGAVLAALTDKVAASRGSDRSTPLDSRGSSRSRTRASRASRATGQASLATGQSSSVLTGAG